MTQRFDRVLLSLPLDTLLLFVGVRLRLCISPTAVCEDIGEPFPYGAVFGWGRRFCQGSQIAEDSLFIVCARMLWAFDFQPSRDGTTGSPLIPDILDEEGTWTEGLISLPRIFPVNFVPRSEATADIIRKRYAEVQSEWEALGFASDSR